jgi:hypothetical protein
MLLRNILIAATAPLVVTPAFAENPKPQNASAFFFKIKHKYVNGETNDIEHKLSAGTLTISGEVWASRCATTREGKPAKPQLVKIIVHDDSFFGGEVCSFAVTPSPNVGERVPFKTTCESVTDSSFHVEAWTNQDPDASFNCTIEASGTLTTK